MSDTPGDERGDAPATPPGPPADPKPRDRRANRPRSAAVSARRRAREFALQGLYAFLIGRDDAGVVDAHVRDLEGFAEADREHYDRLLHGAIAGRDALDALITPHLDRPIVQVSPVEHAALLIGTLELRDCIEIPYRVAINEGVELAKSFGGTDGHRFVNGVLDRVAGVLRQVEVQAAGARPPRRG